MESTNEKATNLDRLFHPESVAHVGVSSRPVPGRFNFTQFLIHMKYKGRIYPVNPKYDTLFDMPCYPTLADVPGAVDLAIMAVPAERCVEILEGTPKGKARFVVIHTSGFGEIDKGHLERRVRELAAEREFRVIGPNCMGVYSQEARIGFWQDHWEIVDRPGAVGFVSQSGGHAVNIVLSGMNSGLNFNKVISLGNQLDVSIAEVLAYMGKDDSIGVIGIYIEDVKNGREFLARVREVTPKKPVVVWKGGTTSEGKAAAVGHTGAMAGDEKIFASAMKQAGAIRVNNMHQMIRMLRLLQPGIPLSGRRLAVFSPGGGNTVNICDQFGAQPNLELPRLGAETIAKLAEILPEENVDLRNPVDPGATGLLVMDKLLKIVGRDPAIETLVLLISVDYLSNIKSEENRLLAAEMISETVLRLSVKVGKPIYILLRQERENHEDFDRYRRIMIGKFIEKKIPWVDGAMNNVAEVLSKLAEYREYAARHGKT